MRSPEQNGETRFLTLDQLGDSHSEEKATPKRGESHCVRRPGQDVIGGTLIKVPVVRTPAETHFALRVIDGHLMAIPLCHGGERCKPKVWMDVEK
jgi:hypothetical protein